MSAKLLVSLLTVTSGGNAKVTLAKSILSTSARNHRKAKHLRKLANGDDKPDSSDSEVSSGSEGVFPTPPALFIRKYEQVLDMDHVFTAKEIQTTKSSNDNKQDTEVIDSTPISPDSATQRRLKVVLQAIQHTKSFEKLMEKLKQSPEPLFEPPVNSRTSEFFLAGEEIEKKSDKKTVKIEPDPESEMLKWTTTKLELAKLPMYYLSLSKSRLTLLVCLTSAGGFCLAPTQSFDLATLAISTLGVAMVSSSANSVNQVLEVPFDSQMNRTKNRVLVRGRVSSLHALTFAGVCGVAGCSILYFQVNEVAAALGALNLFLYTSVYTPMKRVSIVNTWIGSIVGAVPPLIGWASCTGGIDSGAFVLAAILYAWQFPHFNSLSWNLRPDYSKAGYRMMSVTHPDLCRRVALRYSVGCILICSVAAPILDVTNYFFALDSLPLNLYLTLLSWRFYKEADSASSRKLFRFTLLHLPLLMMLMFVSKKSLWKEEKKEAVKDSSKTAVRLSET